MHENIQKRGISEEIYKLFQLKYQDKKLEIPIFNIKGKKIFSKYRHDEGPNKYTYDKGGTAQLYGAHLIKEETKKIVLTEGELDTLVLLSHNISAVSATSGSSSNYTKEWVELLKNKKIYICYDNDKAGLKGAAKLKKVFPEAIVLYLKDVNDISDYYEKHKEVKSIFNLTKGILPKVLDNTYKPRTEFPEDDRINKAKQIPLHTIVEFNRDKKIPCLYHNEKTASLAYNTSNNTWKCFGCGEFGDAIKLYMKVNNKDFPTALNEMVGTKTVPVISQPIITEVKTSESSKKETTIDINFLITGGEHPKVRRIGPNIKKIFDYHPDFKGKFRYDSFNGVFETSFLNNKWEAMEDHILRVIVSTVQEKYPFFDSGIEKIVKDYAILTAMENSVSPPLQYIKSIKWDGEQRLKHWLHKTYHVPDNEYYTEIGIRWLKYLVKRLKYPGCKFDHVLVMKGVQGFGKSMILKKLCALNGKDYFTETTGTPDQGKDFMIELMGNIVVEFAEGAITGYKDQKKIKSFITKQADNYRPPYMKSVARFPRQCVFAMTTNETEFLKDKTGERRYWLMEIPENENIYGDVAWIEANRDQLFAEAYTLTDQPYEHFPKNVQKYLDNLIEGSKEIDPMEDFVVEWFNNLSLKKQEEGININRDIKDKIMFELPELKDKYIAKNISIILTQVLYLEKKGVKRDRKFKRLYVPTERTLLNDESFTKKDGDFDF